MFQRKPILIACLVVMPGLAACSRPAGPANTGASSAASPAKITPITSLNFVKASASEAQISVSRSGEATVVVSVQRGYHVNANPATDAFLKATELVVQPGDGLSVGFIKYPNEINKKFSFSEKLLAVYEGEVPIKVLLKAAPATTKGSHSLPAKLNVQACDDQVCYSPGTLELTIPVVVK
jgi:thiol:disulfide interchange protein DsbD